MKPAVDIQHAVKVYDTGLKALNDVTFQVEQGEFFALLGPNGAGKTTLISALSGLVRLTSGQIEVMGKNVRRYPYDARRQLGIVPQELVYDPFFNVREALKFQSGYHGIRNNKAWIDELLHHLGLEDKATTNTRLLSGGMKRRLMVALSLVHKPPVIVLDEPTAGVDVELRRSLWTFVQSLNDQGHTIILTTHYLEEAQTLCRRIAMMIKGQLVALDATDKILNLSEVTVSLTLSASLPEKWHHCAKENDAGQWVVSIPDYDSLSPLLQDLAEQQIKVLDLRVTNNDLESVFLRWLDEGSHRL